MRGDARGRATGCVQYLLAKTHVSYQCASGCAGLCLPVVGLRRALPWGEFKAFLGVDRKLTLSRVSSVSIAAAHACRAKHTQIWLSVRSTIAKYSRCVGSAPRWLLHLVQQVQVAAVALTGIDLTSLTANCSETHVPFLYHTAASTGVFFAGGVH